MAANLFLLNVVKATETKKKTHILVITVSDDGQAPLGAWTYAGIVMTKFGAPIWDSYWKGSLTI